MNLQLRRIRQDRGISQKKMAELVGVKYRTYGSWEREEVAMSLAQAYDCAVVLRCSIDAIAGHEMPTEFDSELERQLHLTFDQLSPEGQEKVLGYADDVRFRYPRGSDSPGVVEGEAS